MRLYRPLILCIHCDKLEHSSIYTYRLRLYTSYSGRWMLVFSHCIVNCYDSALDILTRYIVCSYFIVLISIALYTMLGECKNALYNIYSKPRTALSPNPLDRRSTWLREHWNWANRTATYLHDIYMIIECIKHEAWSVRCGSQGILYGVFHSMQNRTLTLTFKNLFYNCKHIFEIIHI